MNCIRPIKKKLFNKVLDVQIVVYFDMITV